MAQAVVTLGIVFTLLLAAVLIGEAIYRWGVLALRKRFGRSPRPEGGGALDLGEAEVSEGVEALVEDLGSIPVRECLRRHQSGDWGHIDAENRRLNSLSLAEGGRWGFESAYTIEGGTVLRVITFEYYSGTLILTDEEYHRAVLPTDEEHHRQGGEERSVYVRALSECSVQQDPPGGH
jgi:hypothetical protein